MNTLKSILRLLVEIDFRSHKELLPKDYPVLIGQLKGRPVCVLVIGQRFMATLKQITMLVFDFTHDFLTKHRVTIDPHVFIRSVNLSWLLNPFL